MRDGADSNSGLSSSERAGHGICTTGAALGVTFLLTLVLPGCSSMTKGTAQTASDPVNEEPFHHPAPKPFPTTKPVLGTASSDELCSASGSLQPGGPPSNKSGEPDVWDHLRGGFALTIPDDPRVEREMQWYASRPDFIERVQERARPYLHFILNEVDKRNLPTELALLPVVESAFQPFAYSPGQAAGIWQFIPSTGRDFGLKQTWWYDGRRDVVAATRAALDYLSQLNAQFGGDWALTLAAYNAGAANVTKAIEKNEREGRPTDFWSLDLPPETESYVPKLFGVAKLFQNPEAAGLDLKPIPDKPYFAQVDVGGPIDLGLAAKLAGLSLDKMHLLNPGCNRWATDPAGPYKLLIPVEQRDQFERALADLDPDKRVKWDRYRVRRGDSLREIASRYRTTVSVLRDANNIKSTHVRPGHQLLVPVATAVDVAYRETHQELAIAAAQSGPKPSKQTSYVVRSGDTLSRIADSNGVSVRDLTRWNGLSSKGTLHPGQKLMLVADAQEATERPSLHYRVRSGDSLYTISRHFKVSVQDLRRWNKLTGTRLQPGQKLRVYLEVSEQNTL